MKTFKFIFCLILLVVGTLHANDICDVEALYTKEYAYSLPKEIVKGFLSGVAFDNKTPYTSDEASRLAADIRDLYKQIMASGPEKKKVAILTAGSPGTGKTTLMRQKWRGSSLAYICPDDVCLAGQTRTYLAELKASDQSHEAKQAAYNKWRPASNAATHLILGHLIQQGYGFYYGTTSSSPLAYKFLAFLKEQGYQIKFLHISAPDDIRWKSVQAHTLLHTTAEDVKVKGLLVPQRMADTYLEYGDEIEFYYRDKVASDAILAARWTKGQLEIFNTKAYQKIRTLHNEAITHLNKPELTWERTVERQI